MRGYRSLTRFIAEVGDRLSDDGRLLLFFGTTGDIDYLHQLLDDAGLERVEVAGRDLHRGDTTVRYVTYRVTRPDG